jgi:hypothetical protein
VEEDITEPVQIEDSVRDGVPTIFVSSLPTYASVAGGHVAEDIAEPVQIRERVTETEFLTFVSSLCTYSLQCTKCKWRTELRWSSYHICELSA